MKAPLLEIRCYTDPHCAVCWGMEPVMRRLQEVYGDQIRLWPVMGGLVRENRSVTDTGPGSDEPWQKASARRWAEVGRKYRMPVDVGVFELIGRRDFSSHPACIAYLAARLQDPDAARIYLRRLREAFAVEKRDIQILRLQIALAVECGLDKNRFIAAVQEGAAQKAFDADLEECRQRGLTGFPAYLLRGGDREILLKGYTSCDAFTAAAARLPGVALKPARLDARRQEIYNFISRYGRTAPVEIETVYAVEPDYVRDVLRQLSEQGLLEETGAAAGPLYRLKDDAR